MNLEISILFDSYGNVNISIPFDFSEPDKIVDNVSKVSKEFDDLYFPFIYFPTEYSLVNALNKHIKDIYQNLLNNKINISLNIETTQCCKKVIYPYPPKPGLDFYDPYHRDEKFMQGLIQKKIEDYNRCKSRIDEKNKLMDAIYTGEELELNFIRDTLKNIKKELKQNNTTRISEYFQHILELVKKFSEIFFGYNELVYNKQNKILYIALDLPNETNICKIETIVNKKGRINYRFLKQNNIANRYEYYIYSIVLLIFHELFLNDYYENLEGIVINGYVKTIDKATGNNIKPCILSVLANKNEFSKLNLTLVDPKECFKNLKGVSAHKLSNLTPIAPLIQFEKSDNRFVEQKEVLKNIEAMNLAIMDWEEFEHLISEIFGKEFSSTGGEVKVTRVTKDGGVDAVAFDPDPIRGGKIIIQAKRYCNTVGVSAVRDLYGTVMNEGAIKGILITTSNYGSEAYEFASNKPLTLLNGNNLLFMLEKYGYNAKIDLNEAKEYFKDLL
jgi:restriction system protein